MMNFGKINMILLIVVIVIALVILYFVFFNKKDMKRQDDALATILKQFTGGERESEQKPEARSQKPEEQPGEPTEKEWESIYRVSDKIYKGEGLTQKEAAIQKKFQSQIFEDLEFLKVFYPVCDKLQKSEELSEDDKAFYEANKEMIDAEVNHRNGVRSPEIGDKQPASTSPASSPNSKPPTPHLNKADPPTAIDKRNQTILSFFSDGVPKTAKTILNLFKEATGHDYGKNMHRVLGQLEGKFLTPLKVGNITYYNLPEWFDGRKLKPEYKKNIPA